MGPWICHETCSLSCLRSKTHNLAVVLPEPSHRRLAHEILGISDVGSAEFEKRTGMLIVDNSLLLNLRRVAVFHRDIARRANKVCLFDPLLLHGFIIIGVTKESKQQLKGIRSLRQNLPRRQGVEDLLGNRQGKIE